MAINLQMELSDGRLQPVTKYDAERMEDFPEGQLFNLKAAGRDPTPTIICIGPRFEMWPVIQGSGLQSITYTMN